MADGRWPKSDAAGLPSASTEQDGADYRKCGVGDCHRDEDAARAELEVGGQPPRQRNFPGPEDKEVDDRGGPRIARAVERLRQDHPGGVEHEAETDGPQAGDGERLHERILAEPSGDDWRA